MRLLFRSCATSTATFSTSSTSASALASSASRSCRRATATTRNPPAAKRRTMPSPISSLAPVTSTTGLSVDAPFIRDLLFLLSGSTPCAPRYDDLIGSRDGVTTCTDQRRYALRAQALSRSDAHTSQLPTIIRYSYATSSLNKKNPD